MPKVTSVLLTSIIFLVVVFSESKAQNWDFGVDFMLGAPQGDFRQNVDAMGYGIDLLAVYHLADSPVAIGLDGGFMTYGTTRRTEPFNPNIPEVEIEVRTDNNIAFGHFLARISPNQGTVQPYLDALMGFSYLYTDSKVRDRRSQEDIAANTNFSDFTFSPGFAAGSVFRLYDTIDPDSGRPVSLFLNLRVRYLAGGEAEYLREGSIRNVNGRLEFDSNRSRTDLVTFHLGIVFKI